ncbi:unnamed protein product [Soboliphyme baturini]|uniref:Peroxide-inducible transcript 1 protein n=1 Tax=Soboliphyme baturini TaxID=241478 RepID=A0A183IB69_9BILA|nr:unnamed protein product [Soboliphyme baturini]
MNLCKQYAVAGDCWSEAIDKVKVIQSAETADVGQLAKVPLGGLLCVPVRGVSPPPLLTLQGEERGGVASSTRNDVCSPHRCMCDLAPTDSNTYKTQYTRQERARQQKHNRAHLTTALHTDTSQHFRSGPVRSSPVRSGPVPSSPVRSGPPHKHKFRFAAATAAASLQDSSGDSLQFAARRKLVVIRIASSASTSRHKPPIAMESMESIHQQTSPVMDCYGDDREALTEYERFYNNIDCSDVTLLVGDEM